jgi:exopolysaccharide biosynthesis polyprenyl glycosylphosphotransferase
LTSLPTVVVGGNDEARAIARTLRRRRWMGYDVRGFIDVGASGRDTIDALPVLGLVDDIGRIASEHGITSVIIAGSAAGGSTLQLVDGALPPNISVRVSPGLPNLGAARVVMEPIDGMALFSLRRHHFSRRQRALKRVLDVVVASVMLLLTAPVTVVVALLVRITSPGPILFRQARVGAEGRSFVMYKFRTMVADAETQRTNLEGNNEADGLLFKMRRDPRITGLGAVLRRFSLDELPQLLNVLTGDMSLVGPRPALPSETANYDDRWRGRLRVKPGLTGLWQINGRHDLVFEDYIRYDLFYVDNWSLTMDLYILAKTLPALLSGHGSY